MNADAIRNMYDYHFTINHKIWEQCIVPLTEEQFTQTIHYSVGSARNQVVHMMNIDDRWFSGLRGEDVPDFIDPTQFHKREVIRAQWDAVELRMRDYLSALTDDMLTTLPFYEPDQDMTQLWQILMHVIIHGADHRAQLLSLLNQLGVKTFPQDYYFFVIGHM
ncbi:MAG: DinB family protein [Chloroflexota bacterium]